MLLNINLLLNSNSSTCRQVGPSSLNKKKQNTYGMLDWCWVNHKGLNRWAEQVENVSNMHVNLKCVSFSVWASLLFLSQAVKDYFTVQIHIESLRVLKSYLKDYRTIRPHKIIDVSAVSADDGDQDEDYLHAFMLRLCREWSLSSRNNGPDLWNMTILRHSWLLIGIVSSFKRAICLHLQQWHTYNK